MSRELKFRAWFVTDSMMCAISFDPDMWDISALEGGDDWKVMQYTGLKDKNGREIYEGDILSYDEKVWGGINSFEVSWSESEASFTGNGVVSEWPEFCEVIGSIYENPELLTPPTT